MYIDCRLIVTIANGTCGLKRFIMIRMTYVQNKTCSIKEFYADRDYCNRTQIGFYKHICIVKYIQYCC